MIGPTMIDPTSSTLRFLTPKIASNPALARETSIMNEIAET